MPQEQGRLAISAERGGTIGEITSFLSDLEAAYIALYRVNLPGLELRRLRRFVPIELLYDAGYPLSLLPSAGTAVALADEVPPADRLAVVRVRIESPGFWEVLGSLNPLQQIREYLNDRHKRRQDREFREAAEKEKLLLENELIRRQVYEKENSVLRERIAILRELGYENADIDRLVWGTVGGPLSRLGKHQDTRLIGGTEDKDRDAA